MTLALVIDESVIEKRQLAGRDGRDIELLGWSRGNKSLSIVWKVSRSFRKGIHQNQVKKYDSDLISLMRKTIGLKEATDNEVSECLRIKVILHLMS